MKKIYLLTPGPSQVHPEAQRAMAKELIHHRTPEFEVVFKEVTEGLKDVFQTKHEVMVLCASGTGGMEAAVWNTLEAGDKAIVVVSGKFGERFRDMAKLVGANVVALETPWGRRPEPADIERALKENPDTKVVFSTLTETSSGVVNAIQETGNLARAAGALFVVDAVSGLGGQEFYMDDWLVDVTVGACHKAMMMPPGLAFVALNDRALERIQQVKTPRYYFDLRKYVKSQAKNQNPFTPAISLVIGMAESLKVMKAEGMENVFARHKRLARACRAGVQALGLSLFAQPPCDVETAVAVPDGVDGGKWLKAVKSQGVSIAGGQEPFKGKMLRFAHMGYVGDFDMVVAITALEKACTELGIPHTPMAGIAATVKALES